ncbi:MAG: hypothetical protein Q9204_008339 [Flavoplaca sp. TL-2023a]
MAYDPNYYRTEEYVQQNYPPAGYTPHGDRQLTHHLPPTTLHLQTTLHAPPLMIIATSTPIPTTTVNVPAATVITAATHAAPAQVQALVHDPAPAK